MIAVNIRRCILFVLAVLGMLMLISACTEDTGNTTEMLDITTADTQGQIVTVPTDEKPEATASATTYHNNGVSDVWEGTDVAIPEDQPPTSPTLADVTQPQLPSSIDSPVDCTYEQFMAMSGAQQQAFCDSFESLAEFKKWHSAALDAYNQSGTPEVTGDASIDIGDYLPNN